MGKSLHAGMCACCGEHKMLLTYTAGTYRRVGSAWEQVGSSEHELCRLCASAWAEVDGVYRPAPPRPLSMSADAIRARAKRARRRAEREAMGEATRNDTAARAA